MGNLLQRLFFHHPSNNQKAKLLQFEGITLLVVIVVCTRIGVSFFSSGFGPLPAILGFSSTITSTQVVTDTNRERAKLGLGALTPNTVLDAAATAKGNNMCADQYWAHISPSGVTPWVFMKAAGYKYAVAGENLARDFSDTESMVSAWMNSPSHRENIVNARYSDIGVAVIHCNLLGSDTALVVQMFGTQLIGNVIGQTGTGTGSTTETGNIAGTQSVPQVLGEANPQLLLKTPKPTSPTAPLLTPVQTQKTFLIAILILVVGLLAIDMWLVEKRRVVRVSSRSLGHFLFLSGIFILVLLLKAGVVL